MRAAVRLLRSGIVVQAACPSSYRIMFLLRPLGSTGVTPLPRYYGPVRLPTSLRPVMHFHGDEWLKAGSPRSLDRSVATRCPQSPRRVRQVHLSSASLPMRASSFSADWPLPLV